jgi:hypothetical protein
MATKITSVSAHPNFKPFEDWVLDKMASFRDNGDDELANSWENTLNTIQSLVDAAAADGFSRQIVDAKIVILSQPAPTTPEFEAMFNQWKAEYSVQFVDEEV